MIKNKTVAESRTISTEMIMPNDTNPLGNLMGGNLMRWMDITAGICAAKHSEAHVVTASVDHVSFDLPIKLGNVITITAQLTRSFNSSMEVYVEVQVADITGANLRKSNHAYFSFVALNAETMKPIKAHKISPENADEKAKYNAATRRRELRLILSGRMKPEDATEIKELFLPS